MTQNDERIQSILERHGIVPTFQPAFFQFVEDGTFANADFRLRLHCCTNYQAALHEIKGVLSSPYRHLFQFVFESVEIPQ